MISIISKIDFVFIIKLNLFQSWSNVYMVIYRDTIHCLQVANNVDLMGQIESC
jgi:hypothetical protein